MKKIAVFHPSTELYGADRIMVLATLALDQYQPVIYLPKSGELIDYIKRELPEAEIKIVPNMPVISRAMFTPRGIASTITKMYQFRKFIRQENEQYNFTQFYINTLACALILPLLKKLKGSIFTHVHEILERPKIAATITAKIAFNYSDKVISVSQAVQNNLHELCKKRKAESIIVHNGIPGFKPKVKVASQQLSFYLFGRLKPEKGQWYLLDALSLIPKNLLINTKFNLVGGTLKGHEHLKKELLEKITTYNLTEFVEVTDFVSNISSEIAKADVCLIPSLMKDPFPTTVLEAMSAKKAVIATNIGGAKEAIEHNISGIIIPPNKPHKLAAAIMSLINNPTHVNELAVNAEKRFLQRFTIRHFNQRWKAALQSA